jgi:hypothetical protein
MIGKYIKYNDLDNILTMPFEDNWVFRKRGLMEEEIFY